MFLSSWLHALVICVRAVLNHAGVIMLMNCNAQYVQDSVFNSWGPSTNFTRRHQSDSDMMEGPRMYRRLSQVDMELERTKRKLNFLEQSCEVKKVLFVIVYLYYKISLLFCRS